MRSATIAILAIPAFLAACAPMSSGEVQNTSAARPERQCFNVSQVSNFRQGRATEVYLRVGRSDIYRLDAVGGCFDLDFANQLAIVSDIGGGSRLCSGDQARIIVPGSTSATSICRARVGPLLTVEEVEALPSAHRP